MSDFEVRIMIKPRLKFEEREYIVKQIELLAKKYEMYSYDGGITYCKKPPYNKFTDVPAGVAFVLSLKKYKEYLDVLEYDNYLEGIQEDLNGNILPLKRMIYLLTINTFDSTSIHGAYTDRQILLRDYDMLVEKDKRFSQSNSIYDIRIYCLEPNMFYGEYMDWLEEEDNQFYEKLDEVDIYKLRNPLDGFLEAAKIFVEENKELIEQEHVEYLSRKLTNQ